MNRELRQVRRYWPLARIQWIHTTSTCFVVPGGRGVWITIHPDGATVTIDTMMSGRIRYSGRTIPEAMRAAGFGVRAQGLRQVMNSLKRNDCAGRILAGPRIKPHKWFVELQSTQRPRKGARLGKRKREVVE